MQVWNKRIFAALLCLCMLVSLFPIGAKAALVDGSAYIQQQLCLGDSLIFRLRGNANYLYAGNAVATVSWADQTRTYRLEDLTLCDDGMYELSVDLAAAQMTEDISLTVQVGDLVVVEETYSIQKYIETLLKGEYTQQTKQLCYEVLNYGAWAQKYFGYNAGSLANVGNEQEPAYPVPSELPTVQVSGTVPGISYYGASVRFVSKLAVRHYFTVDGNVEDYAFTVDGERYEPVSKDGRYYIEIPGINPQQMNTKMNVEVTGGSEKLCVQYAPTDFFIRSYSKATDETYQGLLRAAYSYFMSAKAYCEQGVEDPTPSTTEPTEIELPADPENLLLGFDSYKNFTGARIAIGNSLGRMELNKDAAYITQGAASLKVMPQGDYSKSGAYPYLKLDFLDSTCATNNFSNFKSISFDVYNPQSEALQIKVGLVVGTDPNSYLSTIKETLTLQPEGWTECVYDLSVMAGYAFYDLANVRYMTFEFMQYKQSKTDVPNTLYLDNLRGNAYPEGEGVSPAVYDFNDGLDFEKRGDEYLFTGQGNIRNDAVIDRVAYGPQTVSAPVDGGSYALRLSHSSYYWPAFRIHFGETLTADTEITFWAYARITGGESLYDQSIFEFTSGGEATEQFACGQWKQLKITLTEDAEYIDLYWNFDRANITSDTASAEVYIDNIAAPNPEPYGDFVEGIDFEQVGNAELFTGQGNASTDAVIKRYTYATVGITAAENGGTYVLKLSNANSNTPTFRMNFGEELPAGTVISFMVYGKGSSTRDKCTLSASGATVGSFNCGSWTQLNITLSQAASYADFSWSCKRLNLFTGKADLYLDNMKATLPAVTPEGSFLEGVDFEVAGNTGLFTGQGVSQDAVIRRVAYSNISVPALAEGGSYALKLSHTSNYWPTFRICFGEEFPAGTVITFWAYGVINGESLYNQSIFEFSTDSPGGSGEATAQFQCDRWTELSITLTDAAEYIDLYWNIDRAQIQSAKASGEVYLDNFQAIKPVTVSGNILDGYGFEIAGNELNFAGIGASQDAAIQRTTYADAGVTALANAGSYALKLSHTSHYYPTFQMNFGKALEAGTTVTFDVYGSFDGWASGNDMNIEFTGDSGSGQVVYMLPEAWFTATIVLNKDCDHLQFFWNIERNNGISGDVASYILIDNVKAVLPGTEPEPTEPETTEPETTQPTPAGSFRDGVDFEQAQDAAFFGPVGGNNAWRDATLAVVSYADAGVSAPENGGATGLKLTSTNSYWPTLRISFGETLPAGTVITFDAYTRDITNAGVSTVTIFEYVSGGEATVQYYYGSWNKQSITLASDCDHLDLVCTLDRWEKTSAVTNVEVYLDNFDTEVPNVSLSNGLGFENETDATYLSGIGGSYEQRDATFTRVSYGEAGTAAPENGGSYALKLSHTSHYYPTFQLNFGKTLKAGTTVTFQVYGSFDGWTSGKDMNIEFTGDSGSGQVVYMIPETWFTATIQLSSDCDHLQFFWNIERNNGVSGDVASYILIDNIKATEPA